MLRNIALGLTLISTPVFAENSCLNITGFISDKEGYSSTAYEDGGAYSIGYGLQEIKENGKWRAVKASDTIAPDTAALQLYERVLSDRAKVKDYLTGNNPEGKDYEPTDEQIDALTSFVYNLGMGTEKYKKGLHSLTDNGKRDWETVTVKMLDYNKFKGETIPFLQQRREEEFGIAHAIAYESDCKGEIQPAALNDIVAVVASTDITYKPNDYDIAYTDIKAIFGEDEHIHRERTVQGSIAYTNNMNKDDVVQGKIAVVTEWRTDDERDNGQNEFGIKANSNQDGVKPFVEASVLYRREDYDAKVGVGIDTEGVYAGGKAFYDIHEDSDSGLAVGVAAQIENGAVQLGPAVEITGKDYGLALFPTDLAIVKRGGPDNAYRKRYSLNPIAILIGAASGQETALDVLKEINGKENN